MATVNDILEDSLRLLLGSQTEFENELLSGISDSATTIPLTHSTEGLGSGSILSIGTELMRVWSADNQAKTAVVKRGYRGTVAAAHSANELVTVNPKYSKAIALKALEEDVLDLSSPANGLYRVDSFDLTYQAATVGYDVPTISGFIDIHRVHHKLIGPGDHWIALRGWTLARNQDNTSGLRLNLRGGHPGQSVRVSYKREFSWPASPLLTDDLETITGVPDSMHDILKLGIQMRIGPPKEIQRNQPEAQGSSRRAEEVPPGAITRSFAQISAQRRERIRNEAMRLARLYPDFEP